MTRALVRGLAVVAALALPACGQSVFDLAVGDCLDYPQTGEEVSTVDEVACTDPHQAEVYALVAHSATVDEPFPGEGELTSFADEVCIDEFQGYVGVAYEQSALFSTAFTPSAESWESEDDREIVCLLVAEEGKLTGSKRGSEE